MSTATITVAVFDAAGGSSSASVSFAAITPVQSFLGADGSGTTATTATVSAASAITSGNAILGVVTWDTSSGATLSNVKDSAGNSYTILDTLTDTTSKQASATFYCLNVVGGNVTLTATFTASCAFRRIAGAEYAGLSALNAHAKQQSAAGSAVTSGSITPSMPDCLVWGYSLCTSGSATFSAGSGYTMRASGTGNVPMAMEDLHQTSAASIAAAFSISANQITHTYLMAFAPPAFPAPPPPPSPPPSGPFTIENATADYTTENATADYMTEY